MAMNEQTTARVTIYMDKNLKEWLKEESSRSNRSMANYVETLLLQVKEGQIEKPSPFS